MQYNLIYMHCILVSRSIQRVLDQIEVKPAASSVSPKMYCTPACPETHHVSPTFSDTNEQPFISAIKRAGRSFLQVGGLLVNNRSSA